MLKKANMAEENIVNVSECDTCTVIVAPFTGIEKVLHWDFTPASMEGRIVTDASGVGASGSGKANHGLVSESGVELVEASPSLNPSYPCGVVHSNIWRFAASEEFLGNLRSSMSYGGRLQFRCDARSSCRATITSLHGRG